MKSITINDKSYKIETYLGGDLKFLATVCGIDAANCEYACIWCKCPTSQRWDMSQEWSITDTARQGSKNHRRDSQIRIHETPQVQLQSKIPISIYSNIPKRSQLHR